MTTKSFLSPSSRFLVGMATAAIVLIALLHFVAPYDFCVAHNLAWLHIAVVKLIDLAYLILCVWAGLLIRKAYPNPGKGLRIVLLIIATLAIVASGIHQGYPTNEFFVFMMFGCGILGYVFPFDTVRQHSRVELLAMSIIMAFFYAACYGLVRHRWAMIPAALGFLYYIVLLAKDPEVQQLFIGRWTKPTLIVLSALALAYTVCCVV